MLNVPVETWIGNAAAVLTKQVIDRCCTVGERDDLIVHAGPPDIALNQAGMAVVIFDHDDFDWFTHDCDSGWLSTMRPGALS